MTVSCILYHLKYKFRLSLLKKKKKLEEKECFSVSEKGQRWVVSWCMVHRC